MTKISKTWMTAAVALAAALATAPAFAAGPNPDQNYKLEGRATWAQGESVVPASATAAVIPDGMGSRPADSGVGSTNG
jgi:hypothetical protein